MEFLASPTRNLFFTGKGGVGKTSLACSVAVALADRGRRVLLISTDPASNLDEVLGTPLGPRPTPVNGVERLFGMNIDPEAAARDYRERLVAPYRGLMPEAAIASMEEQFSGSCTMEIAAFDEFARWLGDDEASRDFDHVLFDTAPTGHTLRLLTLPSAWDGFLTTNTTGTSCLGPLAGLQAQQSLYRNAIAVLGDPSRTTLILVTRPEDGALREADRTRGELAELGIRNQHLVVNGVFQAAEREDPVARGWERRTRAALDRMPAGLSRLPRSMVPLFAAGILGIPALRAFGSGAATAPPAASATRSSTIFDGLNELIELLSEPASGAILVMGKGGVGKTTLASAVALALADRGHRVHLTTTDPAAHVAETIVEAPPNLTISRIDPAAETAAYSAEVMASVGRQLDPQGQAVLAEDLRSPCTEEIAVFRAFARAIASEPGGFVVLDTAPTGHTILLLDAALAYHREVTRQTSGMPVEVEHLLPRLRDPEQTRVLLVTLPEATPVHEAAQLQDDLRRAGIEPFAWIINQSLSPWSVTDPLLRARQALEISHIEEVRGELARRVALVPWRIEAPVGVERLRDLGQPLAIDPCVP